MTNQTVVSRQAELRRSYATDPGRAISEKRVTTEERPTTDAVHGTVVAPDHPGVSWDYGIDSKVGGLDDLPNPGHLICAALAACMDSTIRMIADHLGVGIDHLEVDVEGDVDVRGCMAMDSSVRPGFRRLDCAVRLQPATGADPQRVRILVAQAERLCVTLDTLRNGVPVSVTSNVGADRASA